MTQEQDQAAEIELLAMQAEQQEQEELQGEWQPGEEQPEPAISSTADIIAPLLKITFALVASRKGEHWKLSDEEATEAAGEYGRCIDHYFPEVTTAPWVGAVMVTGMLFAPRLIHDAAIEKAKQQAEESATAKGQGEEHGN